MSNIYELYIDGVSKGNPGEASCGYVIMKDGREIAFGGRYLGIKTNNEAEYYGLIEGLKKLNELKIDRVKIFSDSRLLVNQINGNFKVKEERLKKLFLEAKKLLSEFKYYEIIHIPREKNKIADNYANLYLERK